MRRVEPSQLESDFERDLGWGDDERYFFNPNRRKASVFGYFLRLRLVVELICKHVPRGARVADLACANGNFSLLLAESGYRVTAVDIQPDFLKYTRRKHTHGELVTREANIIEYRDPEPFDAVILGEVIEHVAHPDQLLASARENLRPGGVLVLTTPNGEEHGHGLPTYSEVRDPSLFEGKQFHWGDHLFLYTEPELRGLLADAGFDVVDYIRCNSSYVSQLKAVRYLLPLGALHWLERRTRGFKRHGKDSTANLVVVAKRRA